MHHRLAVSGDWRWLELRLRGVALRRPAPAELVAAPDPAVLRGWLLGNLRGYWAATPPTGWPRPRLVRAVVTSAGQL